MTIGNIFKRRLFGEGTGGNCICRNCGYKIPHTTGTPCTRMQCPKCGQMMIRE